MSDLWGSFVLGVQMTSGVVLSWGVQMTSGVVLLGSFVKE